MSAHEGRQMQSGGSEDPGLQLDGFPKSCASVALV